MFSLHNFSIFTTENNRKVILLASTRQKLLSSGCMEIQPVAMQLITQFHLYDPLFRLCHHRRAKAP